MIEHNKRRNAYEEVESEMINDGWEFSHEATVNLYESSGTVKPMRKQGGFEWCRVYTGKHVGKHSVQVTHVYKRRLNG